MKPINPLDFAKEVLFCFDEHDVPEVQAIITIILPLVQDHWNSIVRDALKDLEADLAGFIDDLPTPSIDFLSSQEDSDKRRRELDAILLALFDALSRRLSSSFSRDTQKTVRDAVLSLLHDGADSVGLELKLGSARAGGLPQASAQDVAFMVRSRLREHRQEVLDLLRLYLTAGSVRKLSESPLGDRAIRTQTGKPNDLASWRAALEKAIGAEGTWLPFVVDLWAYRWFSIGAYVAARDSGIAIVIARAVIDNRTTPFCRWVDGRQISFDIADRQIASYVSAIRREDILDARNSWPLIVTNVNDTTADFSFAFARGLGLPPYHGGCRTIPDVVLV